MAEAAASDGEDRGTQPRVSGVVSASSSRYGYWVYGAIVLERKPSVGLLARGAVQNYATLWRRDRRHGALHGLHQPRTHVANDNILAAARRGLYSRRAPVVQRTEQGPRKPKMRVRLPSGSRGHISARRLALELLSRHRSSSVGQSSE